KVTTLSLYGSGRDYSTFHCFPFDNAARQQWLAKIRRDNFNPNRDTRVCSWHFLTSDIVHTPRGKRVLKRGAVSLLFEWNNYSMREPIPCVWERRPWQESPVAADPTECSLGSEMEVMASDHDYCVLPATGVMANELQTQNEDLRRRLEAPCWKCRRRPRMVETRAGEREAPITDESSTSLKYLTTWLGTRLLLA
uniref:THAP domain-containing protein 1 n=1 Tax=Gouania willdenowi TaxID=441366 RepID=A0A8C5GDL6_GOUWI